MKTIQEEDLQLLKMEGEKSPDIARQSHALQLLLCREGSLTVRIDGEAQTIRPDQLLISFPGETWEAVSREHPFQGYLMSISQELLSEFLVSPKYLTTVCKRLTGQPATAFINQYLVREIRYQLRNPNKSIQEIGYDLGFANPSFFGKFVKEHLGMTASQLREKLPI